MKIVVDLERLAELAAIEAESHPQRTPERRAAATLWVALTTTKSVDAARNAIAGFAVPDVSAAALQLLGRLAASANPEETAPCPTS